MATSMWSPDHVGIPQNIATNSKQKQLSRMSFYGVALRYHFIGSKIPIQNWFSLDIANIQEAWKYSSGLHRALPLTPLNIFEMN